MSFDGVDDYVGYANNIAFDSNDFTISGWVKLNGTGGGAEQSNIIFVQRVDSVGDGQPAVLLSLNASNQPEFIVRDNVGGSVSKTDAVAGDIGQWYHIVGVKTSSDIALYVDSVSVGSTPHSLTGDFDAGSTHRLIGKHSYSGSDKSFFNGLIDDVRVYTRALSADEVKQLYAMGEGTKIATTIKPPTSSLEDGLVGHWTFDGSDINFGQNKALDDSGNTNHAFLSGMSTSTSPVKGVIGQGMLFDGTNDYLYTTTQFTNPQLFSLSVWFKTNSTAGTKIIGFESNKQGERVRHFLIG